MATVCYLWVLVLTVTYSQSRGQLLNVAKTIETISPSFQTQEDQPCPTWFVGNGSDCTCHSVPGVTCRSDGALLRIGFCMTHYPESDHTDVARCPFSFTLRKKYYVKDAYITMPKSAGNTNRFFCDNLNRSSKLCSQCNPGLGPPVLSYSFKCVRCLQNPYGWFLYIFIACFPSTVFFILVILFQVRATSPQLNFVIFLSQYISLLAQSFPQANIPAYARALDSFYSIWNLEYFRYFIPSFCVSNKLNLLHVNAMEYLVAIYPLLLIVLTYACIELHARGNKVITILWKPFRVCFLRMRRQWDPKGSIIHTFATFLLLSYSKLLLVSYYLLKSIQLYSNDGEMVGQRTVFLDASIKYLSSDHLPFILLACFVICIFVVLPLLFICLYPLKVFQRCLNSCGFRWHALHAFAEAFNGFYKDGTNGTRDCRYFGGFYLCFRIATLFWLNEFGYEYVWLADTIVLVVALLLLFYFQPYKDNTFNKVDGFFMGFMIIWAVLDLYRNFVCQIPLQFYFICFSIPFVYFIFFIACKIFVQTRLFQSSYHHCHKLRVIIERFAGYQYPNGSDTVSEDGSFPHRLLHPGEYTFP